MCSDGALDLPLEFWDIVAGQWEFKPRPSGLKLVIEAVLASLWLKLLALHFLWDAAWLPQNSDYTEQCQGPSNLFRSSVGIGWPPWGVQMHCRPAQLLPSSFPATLLFMKQPSKESTGKKRCLFWVEAIHKLPEWCDRSVGSRRLEEEQWSKWEV